MPSFRPAPAPLAPGGDPGFDPHFGFSPGADPIGRSPDGEAFTQAAANGGAAGLADTCAALARAIGTLGVPEARILGELASRTRDANDPLSDVDRRTFLGGEGATLLDQLVRLVSGEGIDARLRRDALRQAAQAMDLCVTGCRAGLREAVHVLCCSNGGATRSATRRRAELTRQVLQDVARATIGRDPAEDGRRLVSFEAHYVTALEQRLGLPAAQASPPDRFFDAGRLEAPIVARAEADLRAHVTPAAVALSLAEEALERLRDWLSAQGVDPARLSRMTPDQRSAMDTEIESIERSLGPVDRWTLFETQDDGAALDDFGLIAHPMRLAVQVMLNLMRDGAVPSGEIGVLMRWPGVVGERDACRLCHLTEGLWWLQTGDRPGFDAGEMTPVGARQLRDLDQLASRVPLNGAQRAGLARMALLQGDDSALFWVTPRWLETPELTRCWWRRMGSDRCHAWLGAHRVSRLPDALRHRLIDAADEADDSHAFARLLPTSDGAAASAWIACDGTEAVMAAARGGDLRRLRRWGSLLIVAAPAMTARQRGQALMARDDDGCAAMTAAMGAPGGAEVVRELLSTALVVHRQGGPVHPPLVKILAKGRNAAFSAIGSALAHGRSDALMAFFSLVKDAHQRGALDARDLRELLLNANGEEGDRADDGFTLAMRDDLHEVVRVWTGALLEMARRQVLTADELIDGLKVHRQDGSGVYHEAMRQGSAQAAAVYRGALRDARRARLLSREQVGLLLLGRGGEPHALSLAAAAGHTRCVREHLEEELDMLDPAGARDAEAEELRLWCRRGGHAAIGAAMRAGQIEAVRVLTLEALDLQRLGWKKALFPSFEGLLAEEPAIRAAVTAGHREAAGIWMAALATAVREGLVNRRDMLSLLAAKLGGGARLLDTAVLTVDPEALGPLLAGIGGAVRHAGLGSADLMRLLGPRRRWCSPLVAALRADRAEAVRHFGTGLLRLHDDGTLAAADLHRLLALRGGTRWPWSSGPRLTPEAGAPRPEAAIAAYLELLEEAVRRGAVPAAESRRWAQAWEGARPNGAS